MKKFIAFIALLLAVCSPTGAGATGVSDSAGTISALTKNDPNVLNAPVDNQGVSSSFSKSDGLIVTAESQAISGGLAQGLKISIPDVTSVSDAGLGAALFSAADGPSGLFQETSSGFRITRVLNSADQLQQNYELGVSASAQLTSTAGGYLVEDGGLVRGAVAAPWAIDASGAPQETYFSLSGSVLTQVVVPSPEVQYPIVADPQWGYAFTYATISSPNTNWIKIHNCFNCYFPVQGAPAAYPAPNQLLPLWVDLAGLGTVNMECRMGTTIVGTQDFAWSFRATANHYDGYGSNISFNFKYLNNVPNLIVTAVIVLDRGKTLNAVNTGAAQANWQQFVINLNTK